MAALEVCKLPLERRHGSLGIHPGEQTHTGRCRILGSSFFLFFFLVTFPLSRCV